MLPGQIHSGLYLSIDGEVLKVPFLTSIIKVICKIKMAMFLLPCLRFLYVINAISK